MDGCIERAYGRTTAGGPAVRRLHDKALAQRLGHRFRLRVDLEPLVNLDDRYGFPK